MSGDALHCAECGTALNDRELLLTDERFDVAKRLQLDLRIVDWDLCDWCHAEEQRMLAESAADGWWEDA